MILKLRDLGITRKTHALLIKAKRVVVAAMIAISFPLDGSRHND